MNPIESLAVWFVVTGHNKDQWALYEALCFEEQGEVATDLDIKDYHTNWRIIRAAQECKEASEFLRKTQKFLSPPTEAAQKSKVLDAHLDSVWVHLGAALALLEGDVNKLQVAWERLNHANISSKRWADGEFHRSEDGKILKPGGWKPPVYDDLFTPTHAAVSTHEELRKAAADCVGLITIAKDIKQP